MKRYFSAAAQVILGVLMLSQPLSAQQPAAVPVNQNQGGGSGGTPTPPKPLTFPLWKAELPGGVYIIARNSINAVSSQQYILNGVARVTEVNISTAGVFQPRFYYLEMINAEVPSSVPGAETASNTVQEAVKGQIDSKLPADQQPWMKVVKDYPTTTHAGTIEFRLDTKEQLEGLLQSVERTWLTGKSEVFTPTGVHPFNASEELKNKDADADKNGEGGPGSGAGSGSGNN